MAFCEKNTLGWRVVHQVFWHPCDLCKQCIDSLVVILKRLKLGLGGGVELDEAGVESLTLCLMMSFQLRNKIVKLLAQ